MRKSKITDSRYQFENPNQLTEDRAWTELQFDFGGKAANAKCMKSGNTIHLTGVASDK